MKPKSNHTTAETSNQSKTCPAKKMRKTNRPFFEEYYSVISGKKEILNTDKMDSLCRYLLKCAQTCDGTTHASQYLKSDDAPFKVEVRTFNRWLHLYPQLDEAYNELMESIGDKLRERVLKYEVPPTLIHKDLNLYCERYKKLFEWEHATKNKDANNSTSYTLIVEKTKDCPDVPPCEINETDD